MAPRRLANPAVYAHEGARAIKPRAPAVAARFAQDVEHHSNDIAIGAINPVVSVGRAAPSACIVFEAKSSRGASQDDALARASKRRRPLRAGRGVRRLAERPEQSLPLGGRRPEEGIARLDAFLRGAEIRAHAGELGGEPGIVARFAPRNEAKHAAKKGHVLGARRRDGEVGAEMLGGQVRWPQGDIGQFGKAPAKSSCAAVRVDSTISASGAKVRRDHVGIDRKRRKNRVLVAAPRLTRVVAASSPSMNVIVIHAFGASS